MRTDYINLIKQIVRENNYSVGNTDGDVDVIDTTQTITRKQGFFARLTKAPVEKIPAYIASFIVHPRNKISATVFGRSNLSKVEKLVNQVSKACGCDNVSVGLATEHIKYGPDVLFQ